VASPERRAAGDSNPALIRSGWLLTILILAGVGFAAWGLSSILAGVAWWFEMMPVAVVVAVTAAVVRTVTGRRWWASAAAAAAGLGTVTVIFGAGTGLAGVIPTPATAEVLEQLRVAALESIAVQKVPADVDHGILYLLCAGIAAITLAMDVAVFNSRFPALAGIPLLVLLLVPSLVRPELDDGLVFVLAGATYLAILLVSSRSPVRRPALGVAAVALAMALILPLALPAVTPGNAAAGAGGSLTAGLNPIITLGDDLRQGIDATALTYASDEPGGQYLRLTTLDDFSGTSWQPTPADLDPGNSIHAIGPAPGLGAAVSTTTTLTRIAVSDVLSRWLPVPYAPTSITGLAGSWSWEPEGLSVRSDAANARGQRYDVTGLQISPSVEQLIAAGTTVPQGMERYLSLPIDLPSVVGTRAVEVVAGASNNYQKAVALQSYFRGGTFTYSQLAPVAEGYDGSGAAVLQKFLEVKSGYCVHFASAMASMARTLGIPARVAVGFTPGQPTAGLPTGAEQAGAKTFTVTTHDLHAWPELFFDGVGWVRFEPTPGRGFTPQFTQASVDDPATPLVDESAASKPAARAAPVLPKEDSQTVPVDVASSSTSVASTLGHWWWVAVLLAALLGLTPLSVRSAIRSRRSARARRGSATAAWEEVTATAFDLGMAIPAAGSPRQIGAVIAAALPRAAAEAVTRLQQAVEHEAFGPEDSPERDREHSADRNRGLTSDLGRVLVSMSRAIPWRDRLTTRLLPRSVLGRWGYSPRGGKRREQTVPA